MVNLEKLKFYRKLVLIAVFSNDFLMDKFVLKGGSAIELIYKLDSRASVDIDLSMEDTFSEEELQEVSDILRNSLDEVFRNEGLVIFDFKLSKRPKKISPELESFWGGYSLEFKIYKADQQDVIDSNLDYARRSAEDIGLDGGKKLTIDISNFEYCSDKKPIDLDGYTIYVYTPVMIVLEKLRAICQQMKEYQLNKGESRSPRPRDFYDIYTIINHYGIEFDDDEIDLLKKIFAIKKVDLSLLKLIPDYYAFNKQDLPSLTATIPVDKRATFDFDVCFNCVTKLVDGIKID